jgi:hypothetical protein
VFLRKTTASSFIYLSLLGDRHVVYLRFFLWLLSPMNKVQAREHLYEMLLAGMNRFLASTDATHQSHRRFNLLGRCTTRDCRLKLIGTANRIRTSAATKPALCPSHVTVNSNVKDRSVIHCQLALLLKQKYKREHIFYVSRVVREFNVQSWLVVFDRSIRDTDVAYGPLRTDTVLG